MSLPTTHPCAGARTPFPEATRLPGTRPALGTVCAARRYDDDDEFDDELPRRRYRPPASGGNGTAIVLIVIGVVCLTVLLVCGGLIALIGFGVFEAARNAPNNVAGQLQMQNAAVPALAIALRPDGSYQDHNRLALGDPQEFGKTYKLYRVRFEQGRTYVIDLMTPEFDAYLYLADPNNLIIAEDDDGGNGLNSRIIYTAPVTGDYKVRATSLHGQQGGYTLSIRRQ